MGLRWLEQGKFTLIGMEYYVVFPRRRQKSFIQKLSARPDAAQDIKQEFKFVKLRMGRARKFERVGHNVLGQG